MKTTQILKQSYSVANGFDESLCINSLKSQLSDKIFKELINGEKHSLTLTFTIDVNEDDTPEEPDEVKTKALQIIKQLCEIKSTRLKEINSYELTMAVVDAKMLTHGL